MSSHSVSSSDDDSGSSSDDSGFGVITPLPDPAFSGHDSTPWFMVVPYRDALSMVAGFQPRDWDDRWEIQTIGPEEGGMYTTWMSRSWTHFANFAIRWQAHLNADHELAEGEPVVVKELLWETDRSRYNIVPTTPVSEHKNIIRMLFRNFLQVELPPEHEDGPASVSEEVVNTHPPASA
jgi:hypothetical protein